MGGWWKVKYAGWDRFGPCFHVVAINRDGLRCESYTCRTLYEANMHGAGMAGFYI